MAEVGLSDGSCSLSGVYEFEGLVCELDGDLAAARVAECEQRGGRQSRPSRWTIGSGRRYGWVPWRAAPRRAEAGATDLGLRSRVSAKRQRVAARNAGTACQLDRGRMDFANGMTSKGPSWGAARLHVAVASVERLGRGLADRCVEMKRLVAEFAGAILESKKDLTAEPASLEARMNAHPLDLTLPGPNGPTTQNVALCRAFKWAGQDSNLGPTEL